MAAPDGSVAFADFRERVWTDPELAARLRSFARDDDFVAAVVTEGRAAGYVFAAADVRAALAEGRRQWLEKWLV